MASIPGKGAGPKGGFSGKKFQQALNHTRKAELRLQKLIADRAQSAKKWQAWAQDMREAWIKEKTKHTSDLAKMDQDIAEATHRQDIARQEFCALVLNNSAEEEEKDVNMAEEDEWAAMTAEWDQEALADWNGVMQRALQHRGRHTTPQRRTAPAMSPPRIGGSEEPPRAVTARPTQENATMNKQAEPPGLPLHTVPPNPMPGPAGGLHPGALLVPDPFLQTAGYPMNPAQVAHYMQQMAANAGQAMGLPPLQTATGATPPSNRAAKDVTRPRTPTGGVRQDIKTASKVGAAMEPPSGPSLAEKLDGRRAHYAALLPFGGGVDPNSESATVKSELDQSTALPSDPSFGVMGPPGSVVDVELDMNDGDEKTEDLHVKDNKGAPSPGLKRME